MLGIIAMLCLSVAIGFFGLTRVKEVHGNAREMFEINFSNTIKLGKVVHSLFNFVSWQRDHYNSASTGVMVNASEEMEKAFEIAKTAIESYKSAPEELDDYNQLKILIKRLMEKSEIAVEVKEAEEEEAVVLEKFDEFLLIFDDINILLAQMIERNQVLASNTFKLNQQTAEKLEREILISIGSSVVFGIFLNWFLGYNIRRTIVLPILGVIDRLNQSMQEIQKGALQVSSANELLSDSALKQSESVELTSIALEELSTSTHNNADNSQKAGTLSSEVTGLTQKGIDAIDKMIVSINEIREASLQTEKINHSINEIAFQTNLLALNAAVEAARAGEVGRGFAVVAEEVRNLAMRSASAANDTSDIIEGSKQKVLAGVEIASNAESVLREVGDGIGEVSDLISEVADASMEQASGIDKIKSSISQLDKLTQSNADSAQETSATNKALSTQVVYLTDLVGDLHKVVKRMSKSVAMAEVANPSDSGNGIAQLPPAQANDEEHYTLNG